MNTKKSLVVALTAAVAFSSAAALTVSAEEAVLGDTSAAAQDTQTVAFGTDTVFHITLDSADFDVTVPSGAADADTTLTLVGEVIADVDVEALVATLPDVASSKVVDLYFVNEAGERVAFEGKNVAVAVTGVDADVVYVYEEAENALNNVGATVENGVVKFVAPHFSKYAFVKTAEQISEPESSKPEESSQQSQNNQNNNNNQQNNNQQGGTTNTGDSTATAAVFAIVGAAALGTALVASKSKKSAK